MDWSAQIRRYRFERGLTQEALAAEWGVNVRSIRRYEAGELPPAPWLKRLRDAVTPKVRTIGVLDAYKMLVETNSAICTLYDENLTLVAASKPALDFYMPTRTKPLLGIHLADGATPETMNYIAQLGGGAAVLANKAIMSGTIRLHITPDQDEVGNSEYWVRQRFYIVRTDASALVCILLFTDRIPRAEWDAMPPGIRFDH